MPRYLKNGEESGLRTFSLRLPHALANQISLRAQLNNRARNGEICHMLTAYIDLVVAKDQKMLDDHSAKCDE